MSECNSTLKIRVWIAFTFIRTKKTNDIFPMLAFCLGPGTFDGRKMLDFVSKAATVLG